MTDYQTISPADVRVGDEVKVDGYGKRRDNADCYTFGGTFWYSVLEVATPNYIAVNWQNLNVGRQIPISIHRTSIVEARRKVEPKPEPKVGEWRDCAEHTRLSINCGRREVYRFTGWSPDTRKGERRKQDRRAR